MSFIRSGSNPEKLYIWGDGDYININDHKTLKQVPVDTFFKLIEEFIENFYEADEPIEVDQFKLEEKWTNEDALSEDLHDLKRVDRGNYKVFLSCNDSEREIEWEIEMWRVTWMYIIHGYEMRKRKDITGDFRYQIWKH